MLGMSWKHVAAVAVISVLSVAVAKKFPFTAQYL